MRTSKDTKAKDVDNKTTGDEIAETAQLASLAFDGRALSDSELDELCEAVLFREEERRKLQNEKAAWR